MTEFNRFSIHLIFITEIEYIFIITVSIVENSPQHRDPAVSTDNVMCTTLSSRMRDLNIYPMNKIDFSSRCRSQRNHKSI